jgi:hypothetical protein
MKNSVPSHFPDGPWSVAMSVVTAITPTHTLIESDERTISVANATFLAEVAKQ